jgi:hypothetical protein
VSHCGFCGTSVGSQSGFCGRCGRQIGMSVALDQTLVKGSQRPSKNRERVLLSIIALLSAVLVALLLKDGLSILTQGNRVAPQPPNTSTALPVQQPTQYVFIGGLDLNAYCVSLGYEQASLDGNSTQNWHCVAQAGVSPSINMTKACQQQYKRGNAIAAIRDNASPRGGVDCYVPL